MKLVCAWCERVIAGPIVGIEGGDEVAPLICKACFYEVFEEGDNTDISEVYAVEREIRELGELTPTNTSPGGHFQIAHGFFRH